MGCQKGNFQFFADVLDLDSKVMTLESSAA